MGSFNGGCAISNLPIHAGCPVRWLTITESSFHDGLGMYGVYRRWFPRSFPIKAKYNDYGSIEGYESGPIRDLVIQAFQCDMVEKGAGDNICHDVAVSKDMPFDALLTALWEARVEIQDNANYTSKKKALKKENDALDTFTEKYVSEDPNPTEDQITKLLKDVNEPIYDGTFGNKSFIVYSPIHGVVTVKLHSTYGLDDSLKECNRILPLFKDYAAVVAAPSGSYNHACCEIVILGKPKLRSDQHPYHGSIDGFGQQTANIFKVSQIMVREDVWQGILTQKIPFHDYKNHKVTLKGLPFFKKLVKAKWDRLLASGLSEKKLNDAISSLKGIQGSSEYKKALSNLTSALAIKHLDGDNVSLFGDHINPGHAGKSFNLMVENAEEGKLTDEQISEFLDRASELAFVVRYLEHIGETWLPRTGYGHGQDYEFDKYLKHQKLISKITEKAAKDLKNFLA